MLCLRHRRVGRSEVPRRRFGQTELMPRPGIRRGETDGLSKVSCGANEIALLERLLAGTLQFLEARWGVAALREAPANVEQQRAYRHKRRAHGYLTSHRIGAHQFSS
jgi:hypothetical protein